VAYLDRLAAWSPRINLTGARTAAERVDTLVAPVLPLAELLGSGRVIDVGSGNGSPGLVVALLRPDLEVVLVEPRAKRCAFLREAARSAGRPEVAVFRGRHDEYPGPPAAAVLLRALALPLEALRPLVAADGRIFLLGGRAEGAEGFAEEPGRPGLRIFGRRST
jgi:16S rRNA (guanine527-N7)-methyltransferase